MSSLNLLLLACTWKVDQARLAQIASPKTTTRPTPIKIFFITLPVSRQSTNPGPEKHVLGGLWGPSAGAGYKFGRQAFGFNRLTSHDLDHQIHRRRAETEFRLTHCG